MIRWSFSDSTGRWPRLARNSFSDGRRRCRRFPISRRSVMSARTQKSARKSSPNTDASISAAAENRTRTANRTEPGATRFAKGNPGGPGNPFNRQIAAFRKMLVESTTMEHIRLAHAKLIEKVEEGNLAAIRLFFQYAVGKPLPAADPDRVDV